MLSIIFKFSMTSAQYLLLRAVFYRFYDVIFRHCESIVLLERCYLLEKKRLHRLIKPPLLNFQYFQLGELLSSCLGFEPNLSLILSQLGCSMYIWSFLGQNGVWNANWKWVHKAFQMGMVRFAATWHQRKCSFITRWCDIF